MREACRDCTKRILLMHKQRRIRPKKKEESKKTEQAYRVALEVH
jgi:hypothetical protein